VLSEVSKLLKKKMNHCSDFRTGSCSLGLITLLNSTSGNELSINTEKKKRKEKPLEKINANEVSL
jgi:hypothetical protein